MFVLQVAMMKERGGIATAIAHYERMFRAVGVHSALVFSGPQADELAAEGADIIPAPALLSSPLGRARRVLAPLKREIKRRAGDQETIVLVHSDLTLRALRSLIPGGVLVAPCHTDKTKRKASADLVITLNEEQHALVTEALPRTRVRMLGNPFVPTPTSSAPRAGASGPMRINFLGRFEGFKDPLTLINAFIEAKLAKEVTLRLIGAGPLEAELRAAVASCGERVDFAGWLPDAFSHFDERDVLVLPSDWESYSYVIREALHFGVPVIASDIHVHCSALDNGAYGRLFPVGDSVALATILERAAAELPQLRRQAQQGGEMVRARYGATGFFRAFADAVAV